MAQGLTGKSFLVPMLPLCVVELCVFALEFVQDARALGGVFLFGDQSLFEEVGKASEAGGDGGLRRAR